MSVSSLSDAATKREKRLEAREQRKRRAAEAQRRAKIRQIAVIVGGVIVLAGLVYFAVASQFFGLAAQPVGRAVEVAAASHVAEGTPLEFGTRPPSSGKHYDNWFPQYGVFEQDVSPGFWVHNLEHGAVALLFNCPSGCPELVSQLKALQPDLPKGRNARRGVARLLAVPYKDMDHKIAVVAWGYMLELDEFDRDRIMKFYEARIDRGPECQNLVCPE